MTGLIQKAIAGFYYCSGGGRLYECRARGAFRNEAITPLVGDWVEFEPDGDGGFVTAVLPRKNQLTRPPMANLDQLFIVASVAQPSPNPLVIDKLVTVCEYKGIEPVLVITKTDLGDSSSLEEIYRKAGFASISLCNRAPDGLERLYELLRGKVSAFCGNTGVGKSSLLNNLFPNLHLATGDVSRKLGRGRHTTRMVELYPVSELSCYVADTPGFGTMELSRYEIIRKEELEDCFREFAPYLGKCRFTGCSHTAEKGCAVLEAAAEGKIAPSRLESYAALYQEAKQLKEWEIDKEKK